MNRLLAAAAAAAFILTGCSIGSDEPAPVVTVTESAVSESPSNFVESVLEQTWNEASSEDQQSICLYFDIDPEGSYETFSEGLGEYSELVSQEQWNTFLASKCG